MYIALDFDDTATLNFDMWREIIPVFQKYGYIVICVTYRRFSIDSQSEIEQALPGVKVYHTGGMQKDQYMQQMHNIAVSVWIDDWPVNIPTPSHIKHQPRVIEMNG